MKKFITLMVTMAIFSSVFTQSPEKMSYQSVVRDAVDKLVTNRNIGMQVSILKGSISGEAVYVERHFPSTNVNGLVSLEIGIGTIVLGDFSEIDWAKLTSIKMKKINEICSELQSKSNSLYIEQKIIRTGKLEDLTTEELESRMKQIMEDYSPILEGVEVEELKAKVKLPELKKVKDPLN